jgi:acetolactate synthase-1/2/3 large subunit
MRTVDAIAEVLKLEGVDTLFCYPTTPMIEAAAQAGIRPIVCRQERTGVHMADGFSRISNGRRLGVFTMQYGPGAENAFPGISTAFSDASPVLILPLGHARDRAQVFPLFHSTRTYASVTKSAEEIVRPDHAPEALRRAFSHLRMGRLGPALVEIPMDVATDEVSAATADEIAYRPVRAARPAADPRDVDEAMRELIEARDPVIYAGQGVLYSGAWDELRALAELLQIPVLTTITGKSAFPEDHPLSLGTGATVLTKPVQHFLQKADVVFAVGTSLTRHGVAATPIPAGKVIIHATNNPDDINKDYSVDYPIVGDARLTLRQCVEAARDRLNGKERDRSAVVAEIAAVRDAWLNAWMLKLTSAATPINPYRVIAELMRAVDPAEAIVTADSGSPRNQAVPFYRATTPRSYIGWGKSHALGTSLGLIMGAKLAAPDKFCVNFMGDAAFGMTGLDFETAVRSGIPICTIVLNNSSMAIETGNMIVSHERFRTRDIGGNYADLARAMGGWAERIEDPEDVAAAIQRARKATENGQAALLEFITSEETAYSDMRSVTA